MVFFFGIFAFICGDPKWVSSLLQTETYMYNNVIGIQIAFLLDFDNLKQKLPLRCLLSLPNMSLIFIIHPIIRIISVQLTSLLEKINIKQEPPCEDRSFDFPIIVRALNLLPLNNFSLI